MREMENKKRKVLPTIESDSPPILYGEVRGDMEPWIVDWEKRRREREEEIERKEKERQKQIAKARRLDESWELARQCRKILIEPRDGGKEARIIERRELEERSERLARAGEQRKATNTKLKQKEITEMLKKIPREEADNIENEIKEEEKEELEEMKRDLWRKWRGKKDVNMMRMKIPTEEDKIEKKITSIREMIEEYHKEKKRKQGEEKKMEK